MVGQTDGHMDRQRCDASTKRARIAARMLNFSMMETFLAAYHAFTKTHVVFVERAIAGVLNLQNAKTIFRCRRLAWRNYLAIMLKILHCTLLGDTVWDSLGVFGILGQDNRRDHLDKIIVKWGFG